MNQNVLNFWDDEGSNLDFTNPQTIQWWQEGVTTQLLEMGIDSTRNDNNEFEVCVEGTEGGARCHGFGQAIRQTYSPGDTTADDASLDGSPATFRSGKTSVLDLRSGCAGMQRYVRTWAAITALAAGHSALQHPHGCRMSLSGLA
ncbi:hypothetical protein MJ589_04215 [Escherichia coli]|nr:hypothetical protein MJ589_04215 [Escherichia coli]